MFWTNHELESIKAEHPRMIVNNKLQDMYKAEANNHMEWVCDQPGPKNSGDWKATLYSE